MSATMLRSAAAGFLQLGVDRGQQRVEALDQVRQAHRDVAGALLQLLQIRRHGRDLGVGLVAADPPRRRVGAKVEIDEQEAGQQALGLQLRPQAGLDQPLGIRAPRGLRRGAGHLDLARVELHDHRDLRAHLRGIEQDRDRGHPADGDPAKVDRGADPEALHRAREIGDVAVALGRTSWCRRTPAGRPRAARSRRARSRRSPLDWPCSSACLRVARRQRRRARCRHGSGISRPSGPAGGPEARAGRRSRSGSWCPRRGTPSCWRSRRCSAARGSPSRSSRRGCRAARGSGRRAGAS